jgi:hypothetical protein
VVTVIASTVAKWPRMVANSPGAFTAVMAPKASVDGRNASRITAK